MRRRRILALLLAMLLLALCAGCAKGGGQEVPPSGTELILIEDEPQADQTEQSSGPEQPDSPTQTDAPQQEELLPQTEEEPPQEPEEESPEEQEAESPVAELPQEQPPEQDFLPDEDGVYDQKDEVALYIHLYGHLPSNYITKREAQDLGWPGGSLEPYAPGKCIGGGRFGNYEGLLPEKDGRKYTECDIDTLGAKSRGAKRIVFSNDGLIYYTDDHYESFTLLYGEETP